MRLILLAVALTAFSTTVTAQAPPSASNGQVLAASPGQTISVSGTGRVKLSPDQVTFTAGVDTTAPRADDAVKENNSRTAQVIAALKSAGAKAEEIQTSNFSIFPQYDYGEGRKPRILGYQVSNTVTVTTQKIEQAGRLLQAAVNAGVNQASGLSFSVSDPARGRDDGLRRAYADANAKAQTLAEAAGRRLGKALMMWESGQSQTYPPPMPMRGMMMEAKVQQDVPVEAGREELTFTINVTFGLL